MDANPIHAFINSHMQNKQVEKTTATYPFITISRESGAGGVSIGTLVTEKLNNYDLFFPFRWSHLDKDLVQLVLDNYNLSESIGTYLPEAKISVFQNLVNESLHLHPSHSQLIRKINKTILALGQLGGSVIVGRGANLVTKNCENALHFRFVAPLEKRVSHYAHYYGISKEEAKKKIKANDLGRKQYLREHFKKDIDDPLLYHMVINTHALGFVETADLLTNEAIRLYNQLNY